VCIGLSILSRGSPFLARFDPTTRLRGELAALLVAGAYLQVPIVAAALVAGASLCDLPALLTAILTTDLHLAGIALVLLSSSISGALRTCLLLAAAWLLPALAPAGDPWGRIRAWLEVGAALRPGAPAVSPTLGPAAALTLAALLLRTRPTRTSAG
jgi:hypothetical protein